MTMPPLSLQDIRLRDAAAFIDGRLHASPASLLGNIITALISPMMLMP